MNNDKANTATSAELEEELAVEDEEEEEEEFTPSAWNAALAPHRSALRSPDKTLKSGVNTIQINVSYAEPFVSLYCTSVLMMSSCFSNCC